jgi:hypothetical protein
MQTNISGVLPFLAARLNVQESHFHSMLATDVMRIFGDQAMLFIGELSADPARIKALTYAEALAWPAMSHCASLVGIGADRFQSI